MKTLQRVRSYLFLAGSILLAPAAAFSATFVVSNTNDSGPGSLRQAVADSNLAGGSNNISISVEGTTTLTTGELLVTTDATIGPIGTNAFAVGANYASRVFHVRNATVNLARMTIANGSNNLGGGILQESGSLTISNCVVLQNKAVNGGGIAQTNGNLLLMDCTISTNSAAGTGMGIYVQGNSITTLRRCTLAGNTGTGFTTSGGGVSHSGQSLLMENCTLCANGSTGGNGGGALNNSGTANLVCCTIFGNRSFVGGGIAVMGGSILVRNCIIASNTTSIAGAGAAPDCYGSFISGGFNLVGNRTNSTGWGAQGDQIGSTAFPINPILLPLQNNGGLTWTMRPQPFSPVVDKGHSSSEITDQRGLFRPYDKSIPNAPGGDGADIGAFELGVKTQLVTTVAASGPGSLLQAVLNAQADDITQIDFLPGIGNAINLGSELGLDKDFIINGPGASAMALVAAPGQRVMQVYAGKSSISGLTFRDGHVAGTKGAPQSEGMEAYGAGVANVGDLSLIDCVISNNIVQGGAGGDTVDGTAGNGAQAIGGGMYNSGLLALTRCLLANNSATGGDGGLATGRGFNGQAGPGYGGALFNAGSAYFTNCCIEGNSASCGFSPEGLDFSAGGAIFVYYTNSLGLFTCTVASNKVVGIPADGGGIYISAGSGIYRNTTIAGNQATDGGGIYASNSNLGNTLIAANSAASGPDVKGSILSSDYNFIQNATAFSITGSDTHTIYNQNPLLGPLRNNGGPLPTMALLPGSPAIDRGTSFGTYIDMRGRFRPFDVSNVPNAPGGDGTDIGAFELTPAMPVALRITRSNGSAVLSWPTDDPSFSLEASTNPVLPAAWAAVPGTPAISNNQFIVTDPLQARKFYRLHSQ